MHTGRGSLTIVMLTTFLFTNAQPATSYKIQKKITCNKAAVVSAHPLASSAGLKILLQGGNAIDAVIATQLALAVVYPGAGNLGGGGFMVAHFNNGKNFVLDYRETAPAKASRDMYLDSAGIPIKKLSLRGYLASGVPGTVAGLFASMKYARLPFKKLIAPAIVLAERGFAITDAQAQSFNKQRNEFLTYNKNHVAFVKNSPWKAGDILVQKDLAKTLERIRDNGQKGFYEGITAKLIADDMMNNRGIITMDDLKKYKAVHREVLSFEYKGYKILTMPLSSSGGILLQQMMKMVENRNLGKMGFHSPESVQLMIEVERRTFADRAQFLGDNDFVKVPLKRLLSFEYLQERMNDFTPGKAGNSIATKAGTIPVSEETTHISVADAEGNAVAVTTTLNDSYGSQVVINGAGFLMNNEMDDFSVKEGHPNMYGAVGNAANAISPGKRMLSAMTPTIVLKNKKPFIIVGTPGGTTIPTSVFQALINLLEFNLSPEEAINKPKFHHQWLPDSVFVEKDFPLSLCGKLQEMGYLIQPRLPIGRTELIYISTKENKRITAVADKRGDDDARGY